MSDTLEAISEYFRDECHFATGGYSDAGGGLMFTNIYINGYTDLIRLEIASGILFVTRIETIAGQHRYEWEKNFELADPTQTEQAIKLIVETVQGKRLYREREMVFVGNGCETLEIISEYLRERDLMVDYDPWEATIELYRTTSIRDFLCLEIIAGYLVVSRITIDRSLSGLPKHRSKWVLNFELSNPADFNDAMELILKTASEERN